MNSDHPIKVIAGIDSSQFTHSDCRGHAGIYATLGKGCILAMSSKLKTEHKNHQLR